MVLGGVGGVGGARVGCLVGLLMWEYRVVMGGVGGAFGGLLLI